MLLRDLAAAWVRSNCPRTDLQANFLDHFDHAADRGVTCSFTVGRVLTRSGKSYLVYCYAGELFAFELTAEQSARLKVADNMLLCGEGLRQHPSVPKAEPVVWIEEVSVDGASAFNSMSPITGSLRYRTTQLLQEPLAIRMSYEPPGRGSGCLYHHLLALQPPGGTVRFTLMPIGPLHDRVGVPFTGALPLFFEIVIPPPPEPQSTVGSAGLSPPGPPSQPVWPAGILKLAMPLPSQYPPTYDPGTKATQPMQEDKVLSDIRAVLIEVR